MTSFLIQQKHLINPTVIIIQNFTSHLTPHVMCHLSPRENDSRLLVLRRVSAFRCVYCRVCAVVTFARSDDRAN